MSNDPKVGAIIAEMARFVAVHESAVGPEPNSLRPRAGRLSGLEQTRRALARPEADEGLGR